MTVKVAGSFTIVFGDWGIQNPSIGPGTAEDHGGLEHLVRAAAGDPQVRLSRLPSPSGPWEWCVGSAVCRVRSH